MMNSNKKYLLWVFMLLPYVLFPLLYFALAYNSEKTPKVSFIIINKADMSFSAYDDKGNIIQKTGVATGKSKGNKLKKGDMKTPEGVFSIVDIESSSSWSHDFDNDSLGPIKGAYGPFFIRLEVPGQKGIGIHGTHDSRSIGTRCTEGCIRLKNEEISKLSRCVEKGVPVIILPSKEDIMEKK